ncbi:MAG TPA: prepilin-type N-terminal cleavage/methylation domain-containing protein [Xanthomonadaceae bacterium]|nr:prepilin-type N-terminal cleavage/methylation domain-containing protein [Xanthomonadaceae bacterium]
MRRPPACAGFTILELAIAVSIVGLLGAIVSSAYFRLADVRARAAAQAQAEQARQAVRLFALRNRRLPCPDLSAGGNGAREGIGGSCATGAQVGWLPYESLGLARPEPGARLRYAVSRAAGADLVAPAAATDIGEPDFDGDARLRAALALSANLPASTARPFVTGRGTPADPASCTRVVANPAFAIVAPVRDRDADGTGFDGQNLQMAATGSTCMAAPARAMDDRYDDVVVAESASALLGWLAANTR